MNKYRAKKTVIDGITFDSKGEASRYTELKLLEKAGVISDLELQPEFVLQDRFTDFSGAKQRAIKYRADFKYIEGDAEIVEDFKGKQTAEFKLKKKMFLKRYPEFVFRITT